MDSWGGISSLQFALPLFWSAASGRGLGVADVNRLMSQETAKLAGLQHRKGKIAAGYDADFVIWDPNQSFTVEVGNIEHKNKVTPYLGKTLYGVVYQTILAGVPVYTREGMKFGKPRGELIINDKALNFC